MKKKCTCGVESHDVPASAGGALAKISEASGFGFVWNVSYGLEPIWLCSNCMQLVQNAWETITRIAGTDNVNLSGIKRREKR